MKAQPFLAMKFLLGSSKSFLLSFLTWIATLSVVISVAALILVHAVMSGFNQDLAKKIMGFSSHLTLTLSGPEISPEAIKAELSLSSKVDRVVPFIEGEAILQDGSGDTLGVRIRGIDASHGNPFKDLEITFYEDESLNDLRSEGRDLPGILIGAELAEQIGVLSMLGDALTLLYPFGEVGPSGEIEPNARKFRVLGTVKSGYFNFDSKYVLIDYGEAGSLFNGSVPQQMGVFLHQPYMAPQLKSQLQNKKQFADIQTWMEQNKRLFSALKLERLGMGIVLVLMVMLASFNILSMLMMLVIERRIDIAVLRALGLTQKEIEGIFFRAALIVGLLGSLLGSLLGVAICKLLVALHIRLPTPYYIEHLPIEIHYLVVLLTFVLAPLLCLLATFFPARETRRFTIVEALRYE